MVTQADRDRGAIHLIDQGAMIDDPRLNVCKDMDGMFPQIVTTWRTLGVSNRGARRQPAWIHRASILIILGSLRHFFLGSP